MGSHNTPSSDGLLDRVHQWWSGLTTTAQAILIVSVTVLTIIIGTVLAEKPWEGSPKEQCRAEGERQGFRGDHLDTFVLFCKDF
jgi:hypothetical protein